MGAAHRPSSEERDRPSLRLRTPDPVRAHLLKIPCYLCTHCCSCLALSGALGALGVSGADHFGSFTMTSYWSGTRPTLKPTTTFGACCSATIRFAVYRFGVMSTSFAGADCTTITYTPTVCTCRSFAEASSNDRWVCTFRSRSGENWTYLCESGVTLGLGRLRTTFCGLVSLSSRGRRYSGCPCGAKEARTALPTNFTSGASTGLLSCSTSFAWTSYFGTTCRSV